MKRIVFVSLILACVTVAFAQQSKSTPTAEKKSAAVDNPNAPNLIFNEESYTFGEIPEGPQVTHEFKFTNTGKEPLVLANVRASCGCTTPSWPKDPILPGKDASILVTYNTKGRVGPFTKSITVTSNANSASKVIYIKGEVVKADPEKSVPVEQPSMLSPNQLAINSLQFLKNTSANILYFLIY